MIHAFTTNHTKMNISIKMLDRKKKEKKRRKVRNTIKATTDARK
jgi:hypothetical protein